MTGQCFIVPAAYSWNTADRPTAEAATGDVDELYWPTALLSQPAFYHSPHLTSSHPWAEEVGEGRRVLPPSNTSGGPSVLLVPPG